MKTLTIILLSLMITLPVYADTGLSALNIPVGAVQSAVGGQGVALYSDSFSFIHNPASLSLMKNSAGINYKSLYAEISAMQVAANYRVEGIGGLGFGLMHSGVTFNEYDEIGETIGELSPGDTIINASYGRGLLESLSVGAGIVVAMNSLDSSQGTTALAINAGMAE